MTDYLTNAATKAVELAEDIARDGCEVGMEQAVNIASHLTYLAGLIRGLEMVTMQEYRDRFAGSGVNLSVSGAKPAVSVTETWERMKAEARAKRKAQEVQKDELPEKTTDPRVAAFNFRASATKLPGSTPFYAGVRHGYLMAAEALDEVADVVEAQCHERDELVQAANAVVNKPVVQDDDIVHLAKVVDRIEKG